MEGRAEARVGLSASPTLPDSLESLQVVHHPVALLVRHGRLPAREGVHCRVERADPRVLDTELLEFPWV